MSTQSNAAPVIIKRKKKVVGDGHHGGAWKVAYADFVTAMMAFFLLMWLLNATTEKQRKGIADYFNPTVPINRVSGGGEEMFGGDSIFDERLLARSGTGGVAIVSEIETDGAAQSGEDTRLDEVEELLLGQGGESMALDNALKHVVTRQTDEGLVIEVFDLPDQPLFETRSDRETGDLRIILDIIAEAANLVRNRMAIEGHVASETKAVAHDMSWPLSSARADRVRSLIEEGGVLAERIARVAGHADRELVDRDPRAARNNRIEVILLREPQGK